MFLAIKTSTTELGLSPLHIRNSESRYGRLELGHQWYHARGDSRSIQGVASALVLLVSSFLSTKSKVLALRISSMPSLSSTKTRNGPLSFVSNSSKTKLIPQYVEQYYPSFSDEFWRRKRAVDTIDGSTGVLFIVDNRCRHRGNDADWR